MGSLDHIVDIAGFGDACRRHAGGSCRLTLSVRCTQGSFQKCTSNQLYMGFDWVY
jgi:hypothetical protein